MPVYLEDPSVLTKDKLKSELLAHNVELPSGNPTKDVYVQLYLKNLTAQNDSYVRDTTLGAFSSDEELPPPVVSSRSRSSGRKATKKTNKVRPEELDVTMLSDEGLKDELIKHGVVAGPVVASIHKLYEKTLLDDSPAELPQPKSVLTEIQVNHNNNSESDLYSDKEDEVTAPELEPAAAEPEPAPVVDRLLTERNVTFCTHISQHQVEEGAPPDVVQQSITSFLSKGPTKMLGSSSRLSKDQVQKITACEQTPKVDENGVKELFSKDIDIPTGITVTCRRPIKGAAGRPVKYGDLWNDKNSITSPEISKTTSSSSSYTQYRTVNSLPPSTSTSAFTSPTSTSSFSTLYSRRVSAAPPAGQTKAACRGMSLWIKVFLVVTVAAFLFLVYQAMESNIISPFPGVPDTGVQE